MCPPTGASHATKTTSTSPTPGEHDFLGRPIEICIASPNHLLTIASLLRLGIGPWRVFTFTPANTTNQTYRGKPARFSLKVAFADTHSGMTWEIMQPLPPDSSGSPTSAAGQTIVADFLLTHGAHGAVGLVHHVAFDCNNVPWVERLAGFEARGFNCVMTGSWQGKNSFAFFEGPDGQSPLTFETYEFSDDWVWPEADAVYGVEDLDRLEAELAQREHPEEGRLEGGGEIEVGITQTLPARTGVATPLAKGEIIEVINTHGTQVVDFWGLIWTETSPPAVSRYTSMSHTRASTLRLSPIVGDVLLTNRREPVLELIKDTSPGVHDTLIAACDPARYRQLGVEGWHASCAENFHGALEAIGLQWDPEMMGGYEYGVPDPLNLFMNIPVLHEHAKNKVGDLSWGSPVSQSGEKVAFKALRDCVVVMSACPQDLVRVNDMEPMSVEYVIWEAVEEKR